MGTFAKATVYISLDDKESTLIAEEVLNNFTEIIEKEFKGHGSICDIVVDHEKFYTECELNSSRSRNLEWQCEVLPAILAKRGCKVNEFTLDMWLSMESFYFDGDGAEDTFEEFAKNVFPKEEVTQKNLLEEFKNWLKGGKDESK